jgi:hypothetical protein
MLGMRADIWEVLPAAGAFVMAGFRHNGGKVGAAGDCSNLIHAPTRISER